MSSNAEFNAEVQDIDQVTKQVKISIPSEKFSKEFDTQIVSLMRTSQVKGFRPGKAPRQLVERMHGERVKFEVANRLISKTLYDTIREKSIDMIGEPEIDVTTIEPGQELSFTANISIFPQPEISGYDAVEVQVQKREVQPGDIDEMIEKLRQTKSTTKKVETRTSAQKGDVIDASLTVQLESEVQPSRAEPLQVQIGEGLLPEELDQGIIGVAIDETKTIVGKVPDSHRDESLRGKPATYSVTLHSLAEKILPEIDDAFVESLEREAKTVLALRVELTTQLEDEHKKASDNDAQVAILDKLIEKNPFQVPQVLVDHEIRSLLVRFGMVDPQKVDVEKIDATRFREGLGEIAIKRVRGSIIVDRVVDAEKLQASAADFDIWCEDFAKQNNVTSDDVKQYFGSNERMTQQLAELSREKGLELLRSRAKIEYVNKIESAADGEESKSTSKEKKPRKKKEIAE